jgi:formamidopyrimidine-DNA glycosylase
VGSLSGEEWARLVAAIRETLAEAIVCGGSTISDFVGVGREKGYFQINFRVYGRKGLACAACGTTVVKQTLGGRASYCCPTCQK